MGSPYLAATLHLEAALADSGLVSRFDLVEIGARKPEAGMLRREPFYALRNKRILGFEADPEEAARLKTALADQGEMTFLPVGVAGGDGVRDLYLTQHPKCSSLIRPNEALISRYPTLSVAMLDRVVQVPTISLANAISKAGWESVDFIKMDVQGAELEILKGCPSVLKDVLLVCTEVGFGEVYTHQPLFWDVHAFMVSAGFELHHIVHTGGGQYTSDIAGHPQVLWGDVVYFRPPGPLSPERKAKLAILAALYDAHHLAITCLNGIHGELRLTAAREAYRAAVTCRRKERSIVQRVWGRVRRMVSA